MDELKHAKKICEEEIEKIVSVMNENGTKNDDGTVEMTFGDLMGIRGVPYDLFTRLKSGKARGIFDYEGQFLMQGVHAKVVITCNKPDFKSEL